MIWTATAHPVYAVAYEGHLVDQPAIAFWLFKAIGTHSWRVSCLMLDLIGVTLVYTGDDVTEAQRQAVRFFTATALVKADAFLQLGRTLGAL